MVQARDISGGIHFHGDSRRDSPKPRQLPGDIRGFVNRGEELGRLDALLADGEGETGGLDEALAVSVCVLAGTAGVGKTSLALRWAHRTLARFPDGQLYVNLRGYDPGAPITPQEALHRFLSTLGVPAGRYRRTRRRARRSTGRCWPGAGCWSSWTTRPPWARSGRCFRAPPDLWPS
ncbi:ATP-binding protein [Streptomyces malaysiensis]|uniref:ATP-binding protein n=1 Tax=Streptomyces malaysiensis TaxID=92644 RepID=UPI00202FCAF7|nr:ATP-binding protein [Streptomyces malaysiensis]